MEYRIKTFDELSLGELYDILRLRSEVFVVEQNCVYQDIDGKDQRALHVMAYEDGLLVAYARCFLPGDYFEEAAIGRILVRENYRRFGYGKEITKAAIKAIKTKIGSGQIRISAQTYLVMFYEALGFETIGERYLEDGISHVQMLRS